MCVPVVGLRAFEKGCAARASCGAMQQSLQKFTDYMPQPRTALLLKHLFSTVMALPLVNKERQYHCEYKADARVTHHLGEIFKTR